MVFGLKGFYVVLNRSPLFYVRFNVAENEYSLNSLLRQNNTYKSSCKKLSPLLLLDQNIEFGYECHRAFDMSNSLTCLIVIQAPI